MYGLEFPLDGDGWVSIDGEDGVIARFNDGDRKIIIFSTSNENQQDEYFLPTPVQTSDDSITVIISATGFISMLGSLMVFLSSIEDEEHRAGASFAAAVGMMLSIAHSKFSEND